MATVLLENGVEIAGPLSPAYVIRDGERVRVESSHQMRPGDLLKVVDVLSGEPASRRRSFPPERTGR